GLKRMYSAKSLLELHKALIKFLEVLPVALLVLSDDRDALLALAHQPLEQAILHSVRVVGWRAVWMACSLLLIAAVDGPYQNWDNRQKLLRTKQAVRDEYKDSEGKPQGKSKIRQMQSERAQRRRRAAVPEGDVVITTPTHFAGALKYDSAGGGAPLLLAKGYDFLSLKIREVAQEHKVMV
ncbi:EscU/YscU/HrcU family type III secretion system export apparatus switch protein, partial [Pseudomonas aeruginosa]